MKEICEEVILSLSLPHTLSEWGFHCIYIEPAPWCNIIILCKCFHWHSGISDCHWFHIMQLCSMFLDHSHFFILIVLTQLISILFAILKGLCQQSLVISSELYLLTFYVFLVMPYLSFPASHISTLYIYFLFQSSYISAFYIAVTVTSALYSFQVICLKLLFLNSARQCHAMSICRLCALHAEFVI